MENRHRQSLLLKSSLFILLTGSLLLLFGVVVPLWKTPSALPNVSSLMSQTLLDRNGLPIQIPLNEREERAAQITLDEVPEWIQKSFILSEDKRFYEHRGVDFVALSRAAFQSLKSLRIVSGASTITMQLVRVYWPTLSKPEFKLAQMIQAVRIELEHSKEQILTHYFNVVPFAHQILGLKQACIYFFNKSCSRLSMAEGATLAIIPRNPNFYLNHRDALTRARNSLLRKLLATLGTDDLSVSQALNEPLSFNYGEPETTAFHFAHRVLHSRSQQGHSEIKTTLDLYLQKSLQSLFKEHIHKYKHLGDAGAILVVENLTGDVLVYIGSPGYFDGTHGMLDAIQTLRSPGSALKPFIYAYALERGWTLSSVIPDVPIKFKVEKGVFSPSNYGGNFSGPQQMRFALANSKNIPALFLTAKLGEASVLSFLRKVGFESLTQTSGHYGVGVSLGNGEVSLWELVQAYSSLARGGIFKPLQTVSFPYDSTEKRTISKETAYLITDVLSDPQAREEEFGRGGTLEFDFKVSAKTGTSSNYRDHWTVGYSSQYTVGVWKGNADGKPLGEKIPASRGAGLLFKQIMNRLHSKNSPTKIPVPAAIVQKRVCSLSGDLVSSNCMGTRIESFHGSHVPKHTCRYHKEKIVENCSGQDLSIQYVDLPDEYRPWAKANHLPILQTVLKEKCGWTDKRIIAVQGHGIPKIVEPVSGTILAVDPTIPSEHQKLRIQFAHLVDRKNAHLLVNGKIFKNIAGKSFVDWPVTKGQYNFQIQIGENKFSEVVKVNVF